MQRYRLSSLSHIHSTHCPVIFRLEIYLATYPELKDINDISLIR
jgi:hypothetical protein